MSYSSGESEDNLAHAEEAKKTHNVARRATKKQRRATKNKPTHVGVYDASVVHSHPTITIETITEHELEEKLKENSVGKNIDAV